MGLRELYWSLTKDPYWVGMNRFVMKFNQCRTYEAQTECGFKVKYVLNVWVAMVDHPKFTAARMLKESNQEQFIDQWHQEVFLRRFRELDYAFELIVGPNYMSPVFTRRGQAEDGKNVWIDPHALELVREVQDVPFTRYGCRVSFLTVSFLEDESLYEENYKMIKLRKLDSIENTPTFREQEEAIVIAFKNQEIKLKREFERLQSDQKHTSDVITVETKRVGNVVEISWKLVEAWKNGYFHLRGFRREGAFAAHGASFKEHGMCLVETQNDGTAVQHLEEGKEYFYAFFLTTETEVCKDNGPVDTIRTVIGIPAVTEVHTKVVDSLRFSIRVPTQAEKWRVERMLEKAMQQPPVDPKLEKKNKLDETLTSFVEINAWLSRREKELIAEIEGQGLPPKELKIQIAQLKATIAYLRPVPESPE